MGEIDTWEVLRKAAHRLGGSIVNREEVLDLLNLTLAEIRDLIEEDELYLRLFTGDNNEVTSEEVALVSGTLSRWADRLDLN